VLSAVKALYPSIIPGCRDVEAEPQVDAVRSRC
jgi:hypothetical protein